VRGRKEESIDTLMKGLYIMPLPKGNEGLVHVSSPIFQYHFSLSVFVARRSMFL